MFVIKRTVTYANGTTYSNFFVNSSFLGEEFSSKLADARKFPSRREAETAMCSLSTARRKAAKLVVLSLAA